MFVKKKRLAEALDEAAYWKASVRQWVEIAEQQRREIQQLKDKLNVVSAELDGQQIGRIL